MASPQHRTRRLRLLALAGVLVAVVVLVVVLVSGDDDETPDVRATVDAYAQAVRTKDYQRQCDDLLADELLETLRSAGLPCEVALRQGLRDVRRPTLEVRGIEVSGDQALARVHTDAANQPPADVTMRLVKQASGWRVASLAAAQPQPPEGRP
jgi:ketosteroid isomerase-like protein